MVGLAAKRAAATHLQETLGVSERKACRVLTLSRTSKRRRPGQRQAELVKRIIELSQKYPRFGYRKIYWRLKDEGIRVGRERVRIIRKREGLQVPRKQRRRRILGQSSADIAKAEYPNHVWSYDFLSDQTTDAATMKCLTIVDEFTRQGRRIKLGRSITSGDVTQVLDDLFFLHGAPDYMRSDNGPEFIARTIKKWLRERGVKTIYINPGCPWQNPYNESFNSVFRDGCLNRHLFESVRQAQEIVDAWLFEYNHERPHGSLGGMTPAAFEQQHWQDSRNVIEKKCPV